MKIEYDPEADALYLRLRNKEPAGSDIVAEGVHLDFDEEDILIGIEILYVSKRYSSEEIRSIEWLNLLSLPTS